MKNNLIILLLIGQALSTQATADEVISLKLDSEIVVAATEQDGAPSENSRSSQITQLNINDKAALPIKAQHLSSIQTTSNKLDHSASIKLDTTDDSNDEISIEKVSGDKNTLPQENSKLLHANDVKSSALPNTPDLQSAKIEVNPTRSFSLVEPKPETSSIIAIFSSNTPLLTPFLNENIPNVTDNAQIDLNESSELIEQSIELQNNIDFRHGVMTILSLVITIFSMGTWVLYYAEIKSFFVRKVQKSVEPIIKPIENAVVIAKTVVTPKIALSTVSKPQLIASPLLQLQTDAENFLADFDPKRNGSVSEFLTSRSAITLD